MNDVPVVGGKNASHGEMRKALTPLGIRTPDGFATTADAYREFLRAAGLERAIGKALAHLDVADIEGLQAAGHRVRSSILAAELPASLVQGVAEAHQRLEARYGSNCDVAVRSSATAEDLPEASFAGQHVLAKGRSLGEKIGRGPARVIRTEADLEQLQQGDRSCGHDITSGLRSEKRGSISCHAGRNSLKR